MGLLNQVVATGRGHNLDVLHSVEHRKLAKSGTVTPQLVGVHRDGDAIFTQQPDEEGLGRFSVPVALKEHVQHCTVFIDGSPQPVCNAPDVCVHFVEIPPGTPSGFPVAQSLDKQIAELDAPRANGFAGDGNSSFQQEFFDVPITQRKSVVEPHGIPDDLKREPVAGELVTTQHRANLPNQLATTGRLNERLIATHWDDILRLAASIRSGTTTASLMLSKLGSYSRRNGLANALRELGRAQRTLFTLEWLQSPALRKRVQIGLNKGEARNALSRAVYIHRNGEVRDCRPTAQANRASGLNLVVAAIALWNTVHLQRAVQQLRQQGEDVPDDLMQHVSPLAWEHIGLTGDYLWEQH